MSGNLVHQHLLQRIKDYLLRVCWVVAAVVLITGFFGCIGIIVLPETTQILLMAYRDEAPPIVSVLMDNFMTPYALITLFLCTVAVVLIRLTAEDFDLSQSRALKLKFVQDGICMFLIVLFAGVLLYKGYGIESHFIGPSILCGNSIALWVLLLLYYRDQRSVSLGEAIGSMVYPVLFLGSGQLVAELVPSLPVPSIFHLAGDIAVVFMIGVGVNLMVNAVVGRNRLKDFFKSWIVVIAAYIFAHCFTWIILLMEVLFVAIIAFIGALVGLVSGMPMEEMESHFTGFFCTALNGSGGCERIGLFPMMVSPILFAAILVYEKFRLALTNPWGWISFGAFIAAFYSAVFRRN